MLVTLYSGSDTEVIEINTPSNNQTVDLDFNGRYLIQCEYKNKEFVPTGNGMDGGGNPLNSSFYKKCIIE